MKTYQPSLNRSWLENAKGYSVQKIPGDHSVREHDRFFCHERSFLRKPCGFF